MQPAKRPPTPLPEHPLPDVARLTEVLDRHGVDYLVIGGVATQAYGSERPTGDFDCLAQTGGSALYTIKWTGLEPNDDGSSPPSDTTVMSQDIGDRCRETS